MGGCFYKKIVSRYFTGQRAALPKGEGLLVYARVVMSNHAHFIFRRTKIPLSDIIRDLKKFTAKRIHEAILNNPQESRKKWMLWLFNKDENIWFWEEGYNGEEIFSKEFFNSKMHYIHANPVRAGVVEKEEEYLYSSGGEYYGIRKSLLELTYS